MLCIIKIKQEKHMEIDGKKVELARVARGWTITKLANESGVARKTIGEIEKGAKKRIRFSTINQIAQTLNKKVEQLCTRIEKGGIEDEQL
ncbi:helix-turn-helix transcriptional regulator [Bacillus sp. FJAT-45350]|uniref:helix-turn-helix transcriptional regulator n=1 Tax=Bacillus sp. FJAT-45350 TaxID=2011014 RepID=UPI001C534E67|nr:helix-turn-helix transcriptional regulator [Bacillus sp. FJAT-45350]